MRRKGQTTYELEAPAMCFRGVYDVPQYQIEQGLVAKRAAFPDTPQGVKDAFDFMKEKINWVKRRGFCQDCRGKQPPKKRIRLSTQPVCGECLMGRVGSSV